MGEASNTIEHCAKAFQHEWDTIFGALGGISALPQALRWAADLWGVKTLLNLIAAPFAIAYLMVEQFQETLLNRSAAPIEVAPLRPVRTPHQRLRRAA